MNEAKKFDKNIILLIISCALLLLMCIIFIIYPYIKEYNATTSKNGRLAVVTINEGDSAYDVGTKLSKKGLIKTRFNFVIKYHLNRDKYPAIYPGEYNLHHGMCLADILKKVSTPPQAAAPRETFVLTIPEGYSAEMIAARCNRLGICTEEDFLAAVDANDYTHEFIKYIPEGNYRHKLEGFLFPATYEFYVGATPHEMVDKMLATFQQNYLANFSNYDNMFYNVTVASIIEREAALASERATISGVIKNRLEKPMKLEIDATAVYGKTNGYFDIETVTAEDVQYDTIYNTYIYYGLPPGPICSSGIMSIIAAANPEEHNWYFYHTDTTKNDGSHIFTETFDDHNSTMN